MTKLSKYFRPIAGTLVAVIAASAVFCVMLPTALGDSVALRAVSCAAWLLVVAAVVVLAVARPKHEWKLLARTVERISQDVHNQDRITQTGGRTQLHRDSRRILMQVRNLAEDYHTRLQDVEHARESAEVRLRRLANDCTRMQSILDGVSDPILVIDKYDEVVLSNLSADKLFQLSDSNGEQRELRTLLQCQELIDLLSETRQRKTPCQRTREMTIGDGQQSRPYRVKCTGLSSSSDAASSKAIHGAVAVFTDISHEKEIRKRNAEFVSSASHEMKTPLAGIKAYVELLADGEVEDEETRNEFLDVIDGQADRLQRLVENLLNIARIEAGVVEVNKQPISLNEVLEEALDVVQPAAEKKQIELVSELSPMFLSVLVDRDMMLQGTINLLSNAIKYTPGGGNVALRSRMQDDKVMLEVADSGVGLSREDCEKVFDRFYRVKKERNMAAGTGLGLPLVKHIVEDVHGGQIDVESELGTGSTFRITLALYSSLDSSFSDESVLV
ncbi:MAG: hypothetical protein IH991_04770 [Planctomycetes bacterium]|nr:hypothetical protein [Planctomycetota bacterium]